MCGRAVCNHPQDDLRRACTYRNNQGNLEKPRWRQVKGNKTTYQPSCNVCPGNSTPVMVSAEHFEGKTDEEENPVETKTEYVLQPMRWGLIPSWHKGDPATFSFSTINCRSDSINSKSTFKAPMTKGRRCVVLFDGYYEWKSDGKSKQPYFIHFPWEGHKPASSDADTTEFEAEKEEHSESDNVYTGKRLLTAAGLFDVNRTYSDGPLYSYSVITVDASKPMSVIHNRMPALLDGEDEISQWLDFGNISFEKAMKLLKPVSAIDMYPVARDNVGNVRNKSEDCIKPIELNKKPAESKLMSAWLKGGSKKAQKHKQTDISVEEPPEKTNKQC